MPVDIYAADIARYALRHDIDYFRRFHCCHFLLSLMLSRHCLPQEKMIRLSPPFMLVFRHFFAMLIDATLFHAALMLPPLR